MKCIFCDYQEVFVNEQLAAQREHESVTRVIEATGRKVKGFDALMRIFGRAR